MKKIRWLPILLVLCIAFSAFCPASFALADPYLKSADGVIVVDLSTGQILYAINPDTPHSIASLTKIMTCLLAVEAVENGRVQLTDKVTAQADCLQGLDVSSSNAGIQPGEVLTYEDLLYCALVHSANDACNVLATYIEGSISGFVSCMNQRAAQLGCVNTQFIDTDGMLNKTDGHYSSPYDLYLIASEAMRHPLFKKICSTCDYTVSATNYRQSFDIHNSNALMTENGLYGKGYKYDGVVGIKTGFTNPAGYCLVSTCHREDKNIMAVVLGCNGVLTDTFAGEYQNFIDSASLYDWVFRNFSYHNVFIAGERLKRVEVQYAKEGETVPLCPDKSLKTLLSNEYTDDDIHLDFHTYDDRLVAPIEEGTELGYLDVYVGDEIYTRVNLLAGTSVEMEKSLKRKNDMREFFASSKFKTVVVLAIAAIALIVVLVTIAKIRRRRRLRAQMLAAQRRKAERMRMERERMMAAQRERAQAARSQPVRPQTPVYRESTEKDDFDDLMRLFNSRK